MKGRHLARALFFFICGAVFYPSLEVLFRGYSHYSMALAGGVCCVLLYFLNILYAHRPLWLRALVGAFLVCLVEFIFGVIFNILLGMGVWDYSALPMNIMGQVCLRFFFIWCALAAVFGWMVDELEAEEAARVF